MSVVNHVDEIKQQIIIIKSLYFIHQTTKMTKVNPIYGQCLYLTKRTRFIKITLHTKGEIN